MPDLGIDGPPAPRAGQPTPRPAPPARPRAPRRSPHTWGVAALALLTGAAQAAIGFQQYRRFRLGGYDLVIFDQAIRRYARFSMPVSLMKDTHNPTQAAAGYGHALSILGDHFSPILALLAPLYWIWDDPRVLLLAQAALFAAAVPVVWAFTRRAFAGLPGRSAAPPRPGPALWAAYAVAAVFGLCWELQEASAVGFHEVAFFVPLCALALERLQAGKPRQALAAVAALLLVKEDAGYVAAMFGLLLAGGRKASRRRRWTGLAVAAGGIAVAQLVLRGWIAAFGGRPDYYWYWTRLSAIPSMRKALLRIVTDPAYAYHVATTPGDKVLTFWWLFAPLLLLSLCSPIALLAVPLLAERAFSDDPGHWGLGQHYNAFLAPILFLAAVDGARRVALLAGALPCGPGVRRAVRAVAGAWVVAVVVIAAWPGGAPFPLAAAADPAAWRSDAFLRSEAAAVAVIPHGAAVEADDDLSPHLSAHTQVVLLDHTPRLRDWVALETTGDQFPLSRGERLERVGWLLAHGYHTVFARDGVYVLRGSP